MTALCDRCGNFYEVRAWPPKALCPCCDPACSPHVRIAYMHSLERVGRIA